MKKVVIVGFGRFGQLLAQLLKSDFKVHIVEVNTDLQKQAKKQDFEIVPLQQVGQADYIFLAVPISSIENVIKELAPLVNKKNLVMDLCSVKVYPAKLMKKYLAHCQTLACHPLFGPDSAAKGLVGLKIVLSRINVNHENYLLWEEFWSGLGLQVIELTPEEHDQDAVYSQAFTYSLARLILDMKIPELKATTKSFVDIKEIANFSARDSEMLFHDMLFYNPYFQEMKERLEASIKNVISQLDDIEHQQRTTAID